MSNPGADRIPIRRSTARAGCAGTDGSANTRVRAFDMLNQGLTVQELLGLWQHISRLLKDKGVIRTRNVIGDYAEHLVWRLYGGELGPPAQHGWDVRTGDGRLIQVKGRAEKTGARVEFGTFGKGPEDLRFHYAVLVRLDDYDLGVVEAVELPKHAVHERARSRGKGLILPPRVSYRDWPEARDVTEDLARIAAEL